MKLRKISFVMAVIMIITCLPISGFAVSTARNTKYEEMLGVLTALDIVKNSTEEPLEPDANVTRAEMVVMATKLLKVNTIELSEEFDLFYDVSPEHEAYNEIIMAYKLGIISGVDNERFDPQGSVTYEQAIKILVSALGYETVAQQMGGYPHGYLATAMKIGLLDGVVAKDNMALTHSDIVKMVFNALEIDVFDASYYLSGGDYVEQIQEGRTLLEERLDIKTVRGTVTQNKITGLTSEKGLSGEQVLIDGEIYSVGNTNIAAYLGYKAKVYYKEENSIKEILYFTDIEKNNEVLVLSDKDELQISYSGGKFTLSYLIDKRRYTKNVTGAACIYNGVYVKPENIATEGGVMEKLAEKSLSVKLIDNDRNGTYDVIVIGAYTSVLVNTVSVLNEKITYYLYGEDRVARINELNISDDKDVEYTVKDSLGNEIELSDIEAKTVISIYEDLSGKNYEIRLSTQKMRGEIFTIDDTDEYGVKVVDNNDNTDGEAIEVTNDEYFKKSPSLPGALLKLGLKTTFYLDFDGNIAAFDMGSAVDGNYGVLMACGVKSGINGHAEFKILTNEGNVIYLEGEQKITAYNPHSGRVEKTDASLLVDRAANVAEDKKPYYLWLTENQTYFNTNAERAGKLVVADASKDANMMQFYDRIWLTDAEKSDIASRKMVYYKTNSDGKITTILVPDIPDARYNKLTTMNGPDRYTYKYVSGFVYDPSAGDTDVTGGKDVIKLSEDVRVFSCLALDYNAENFIVTSDTVLNGTSKMRIYSVDGSADARLVLRYSVMPREATTRMVPVVVKSVIDNRDGTYRVKGFSRGAEYDSVIAANTRLMEPQISSSDTSFVPIKQSEAIYYVTADNGGYGDTFCDYSTMEGSSHAYADNESIRPGDIILVGKDRRDEICYVEMAVRAQNGIMLYPSTRNGYVNTMTGDTYKKGTVTGFSVWGDPLVSTIGYYNSSVSRSSTPTRDFKGENFDYYKDMFHNLSKCKSIWIFDYKTKTMETASFSDIMLGDELMLDGTAFAPVDCIILRNYPNDYYMNGGGAGEEEDIYTGNVAVDFYNFTNSDRELKSVFGQKCIPMQFNTIILKGSGYSLEVGENNTSDGANPIFLVKRPGSTQENDYCAILPNVGYTDDRRQEARPLNPRTFNVLLGNARSADGATKLVVEFDYFATAAAAGSITLNNPDGAAFLTIDMDEEKATLEGAEIYNYITGGGNDGFATVQIAIDRTAKTADIYVDGVQKKTGAALSADFTGLQSISFTQTGVDATKQTGDVYVDNVNIYENNELHSVTPDPVGVKIYAADENFDRFTEANASQLNNAESGAVKDNAYWSMDSTGYKNSAITAAEADYEGDMCYAIGNNTAAGFISLRFPFVPFILDDTATSDKRLVIEWDMKYAASLGDNFLTLKLMNHIPGYPDNRGKDTIINTTLGYDAGNDINDKINQKWHKVVMIVDEAANYKLYKVYEGDAGEIHAELTTSGSGTIPTVNIKHIQVLRFERKLATEQAYIDNLKIYTTSKSMVESEFNITE